jgi:integrase
MPGVRLRGLNRLTKTLSDGTRVTYWYAWKGGPRLEGAPGSPEFVAGYNRAIAARTAPKGGTLASLVQRYRAAPEFTRLADSTQAEWRRWLSRIEQADIGRLTFGALGDPEVRGDLLEWRDGYADRARTADYGVQVLSRVLAWGLDRGLIRANHLQSVGQLSAADRADQIWTADELARFAAAAKPHVARALRLACATGLRRGDLVALDWIQVGELAIVLETFKGRRRRAVATIPLLDDARAILAEIGRPASGRGPVLLNSRGEPWSADGLENRILKAKAAADPPIAKRLHDARGTFATFLRVNAGLTSDEIAAVMAWEKDRVERLLARYVDNERFILRLAERMNRRETGTETPN